MIELIIVIAIFAILASAALASQGTILVSTYLDSKKNEILLNLRLAQMRSIARFKNSSWGVYFDEDSGGNDDQFVVFNGVNYASRNSTFDIVTTLPDSLSLANISLNGGGSEVVFEKLTGITSNFGSLQISDVNGNTITVSVNSMGVTDVN